MWVNVMLEERWRGAAEKRWRGVAEERWRGVAKLVEGELKLREMGREESMGGHVSVLC